MHTFIKTLSCRCTATQITRFFGVLGAAALLAAPTSAHAQLPTPDALSESSAALWFAFADGSTANVSDDATRVQVGSTSLRFETNGGFDTGLGAPVSQDADWDLSETKSLRFWLYAENPNIGFQNNGPWIILNNSSGAWREIHPTEELLNLARDQWIQVAAPLSGGPGWTVTEGGSFDIASVDWIEIHGDTWEFGFTLWIDGVEFVDLEGSGPSATSLTATAYHTTTELGWTPSVDPSVDYYEVFRKLSTESAYSTVGVGFDEASFSDHGLAPGATYDYRVLGLSSDGSPVTMFSAPVTASTAASGAGYSVHASFDLLVAIYTDGFSTAEVDAMRKGIELAIDFYWRTTAGNLLLRPRWLVVDEPLPGPDWGNGALQLDLRNRGIQNDQYDLAYLIGQGVPGCLGGYLVFGSTCASLGYVCGVPYPLDDPTIDTTTAWTFTHEIHHALELMENITGAATPEVLFCHFPWAYPDPLGPSGWHIDWGPHWDGIAATNRDYGDQWNTFPAPYDDYIECVDADGDGLPDLDPRVPWDEATLGTSAGLSDTDDDGLSDLDEVSRYTYGGVDPLVMDTDGDGTIDGDDHQPLYRVAAEIPQMPAPAIDGLIEPEWELLSTGFHYTRGSTDLVLDIYAAWDTDHLSFAIRSDRKLRFALSIDGSGDDGRYESPVRHVEGATDTSNLNNKHNHIGDSWADGNHIEFAHGEPGAQVWGRSAIAGASVASTQTAGPGAEFVTEIRLPSALPGGAAYTWYPAGAGTPVVDGLSLVEGQVIGLNLVVAEYATTGGGEYTGTWTSLFEAHSFVDVVLAEGDITGVTETGVEGVGVALQFPNPFRPGNLLTLRAPDSDTSLRLDVFDVAGRHVRALHDGPVAGGTRTLSWLGVDDAGKRVTAGVYFLRVREETGQVVIQRKAIVTR